MYSFKESVRSWEFSGSGGESGTLSGSSERSCGLDSDPDRDHAPVLSPCCGSDCGCGCERASCHARRCLSDAGNRRPRLPPPRESSACLSPSPSPSSSSLPPRSRSQRAQERARRHPAPSGFGASWGNGGEERKSGSESGEERENETETEEGKGWRRRSVPRESKQEEEE